MDLGGVEPPASAMRMQRSSQLSYRPKINFEHILSGLMDGDIQKAHLRLNKMGLGGPSGDRTHDLRNAIATRYQLRYGPGDLRLL